MCMYIQNPHTHTVDEALLSANASECTHNIHVYVCSIYSTYNMQSVVHCICMHSVYIVYTVRSMHCLQAHTMYNIKMYILYVNEMEHMKCESYQQHLRKAFYTNSCISGRAACMGSS